MINSNYNFLNKIKELERKEMKSKNLFSRKYKKNDDESN
jgi:hypothetical protein